MLFWTFISWAWVNLFLFQLQMPEYRGSLDQVIGYFPAEDTENEEPDIIKIAVVGRPNVGKSSLST